jgi:hypothetical protein
LGFAPRSGASRSSSPAMPTSRPIQSD